MSFLTIEIIGTLIGLTYLYLEYKASFWLWTAGIIMSIFYIYIYYHGKFYADMGTYIYYLGANIYGLLLWKKQRDIQAATGIIESETGENHGFSPVDKKKIWPMIGIFVSLYIILFLILYFLTDSPVPYGDSFTTALSIIAMWLMAKKHPEHWILWTIVNIASVGLYTWKGLYPTAILFIVYTVVSIMGYFKWSKLMKQTV